MFVVVVLWFCRLCTIFLITYKLKILLIVFSPATWSRPRTRAQPASSRKRKLSSTNQRSKRTKTTSRQLSPSTSGQLPSQPQRQPSPQPSTSQESPTTPQRQSSPQPSTTQETPSQPLQVMYTVHVIDFVRTC